MRPTTRKLYGNMSIGMERPMELLKRVYSKNFLGRTSANILSQDSDSLSHVT